MDATTIVAAAALLVSLAGPALFALMRFSVAQVELRLATVERRQETLQAQLAASEIRVAVVTAQHDTTSRSIQRIERDLARLTTHVLGRSSTSEEEP